VSFETTTLPKILFVDDEEPILGAARRLLRSHKVEVLTARNGAEALQIINTQDVWAVISDYRMPGMTGAELLERLRREKPEITRVMLTGFIEIGIMQEAVNRAGSSTHRMSGLSSQTTACPV
jgi:CheY-like chemotaxis protein